MSGPKTAKYILTPEQQRKLQEERRRKELELKTQAAFERKEKARKLILISIKKGISLIKQAYVIAEESKKELSDVEELEQLLENAEKIAKKAESLSIQNGFNVLYKQEKILTEVYQQLATKQLLLEKNLSDAKNEFREELTETISLGFQLSFKNLGKKEEKKLNPYITKIQAALESISLLSLSDELKITGKEIQQKAEEMEHLNNIDFLENFYALTVFPFIKECKKYHALYMQYGEEYEVLLQEYEILTKETNTIIKNIPFSENAIVQLQAEIQTLKKIISIADEQAYISQCMDEIMTEMGYHLIGSREVTKKSGKHFYNELYLFDEGTAVNVTKSDTGYVTMELGGLDCVDRIPSYTESKQLYEKMTDFCTDYLEIEKKFSEKGIFTKRICILSPEEQYAQIINTTDYQMQENVVYFETEQKKKENISATLRKEV